MVKTNTIEFCTKKNKDRNAKESNIINKLYQLNTKIVNGDNRFELLNELEKQKKELEIIRLNKTMGAIDRSRTKFIEKVKRTVNTL